MNEAAGQHRDVALDLELGQHRGDFGRWQTATCGERIAVTRIVAQRIERWATVVDPQRLMAGVDCGFSIHAGMAGIDPEVAWAKLGSLAEGCRIAEARLFG